jgi:tetratricopeptide (TPR) repeat protein
MKSFARKEVIFLVVLFLFALGLRLIYLGQLQDTPWFDAPIEDAQRYDEWAMAIRQGTSFHQGPYFQAPLYPYFLAAVYALFGHSYLAPRVVQFLMGAVSVLLIYFLGKRTFGPQVGRVAAVLAALYGTFIYFEGELLIPALILFLNLLLMLAVLSSQERPSWWKWLGCGAILGVSAIARPTVLAFLGVLAPWMVVRLRRQGLRFGRILAHVAVILLGAALLISPVAIRNWLVAKEFVPISGQGGVNFFIGNNPQSDGTTPLIPGARASWWGITYDAVQMAEEAEGRSLKASEVSGYWFKRGLGFMRDDPGAALRLTLRKVGLFWGGPEMANNKDIYFFSRWTPLLRLLLWRGHIYVPFGIVAPLALAGMLLAWRRREGRGGGLMAMFVFVYMAGVVLFFVNSRFRMPVIPFLLPFAAYSLVSLFRTRGLRVISVFVILILAFGLVVNLNLAGYAFAPLAESHNRLGSLYLGKKMYPEAEREFRQALSTEPDYVYAIAGLARVYGETERVDRAIEQWERAVHLRPGMMELHFQLGFSYYAGGRLDEAIARWEEASRLQPEFAQPHFQRGIALEDKGEPDKAAAAYRQAIQANPRYVIAHYNLGHLYKKLGRGDEAIEQFRQAIEINPNFADAYNSLAWLFAQEGTNLDEGVELINKALELDEGNGAYWDTLAELYIKRGQPERAREIFRKMIQREPQVSFWRERLREVGG